MPPEMMAGMAAAKVSRKKNFTRSACGRSRSWRQLSALAKKLTP
jgi:hypothetical protein